MYTEKRDSMIKETLKNLCCFNGWCYGIFWGFEQRNSLLLTLKDAYYEEQMRALIDNMLMQVHVLGGGVIGQAAFAKNHRWMSSDAYHEKKDSLGSFEVFQEDSDFHCQFSMGIKTIAIISVEESGVVQLGSTQKIPESKEFVDQVKELFRGMDKNHKFEPLDNEPSSSDSQFFDVVPSQSFPSTSDHQLEQLLLQSDSFFDCDCSVLTSSWPHLLSENVPFSTPSNYESYRNSSSNIEQFSNDTFKTVLTDPTDCKAQRPYGLLTLDELFEENTALCKSWTTDEIYELTHPTGLILSGQNSRINISDNLPTDSMQSSVTDTFRSDREEKCSNTSGVDKLSNNLGARRACEKPQSWILKRDDLDFSRDDYKVGTSNSLFSKLGLDQLLDGVAKSRFEDQSSSKRNLDYDSEIRSSIEHNSEVSIKEPGLCFGDNSSSKRHEEHAKTVKKKAKTGTRPRPKDRQMIQDRLAELRELIPNGEKMSIDRLLERTIRHLNFMNSLTQHAECLKQIDKTKIGVAQKGHSSNGGGVTWACEVGNQTMVCPLIVEDLTTPGQMLIEILCEEQGFFLEIVDIIRGFGLIIMNGTMEVRETKIWAHFIVESKGNRHATRHEIFSSLIQLLQMSGRNATNTSHHFDNVISSSASLLNNCQFAVPFPVNLVDTVQCANL